MTELEKAAFAYATKRQQDPCYPVYNWETEISDAYIQGHQAAVDKACEWLWDCGYIDTLVIDDVIDKFKKYMEERK